jgi:hypothetical protein
VPVRCGGRHVVRMDRIRGQADLIYRHGSFFLHVIVDAPEPTPDEPTAYLSVDLGIRNVAADSDGQTYAGGHRKGLRRRCTGPRSRLQRKEHPFATNVNHFLSKRQVAKAKAPVAGLPWRISRASAVGSRLRRLSVAASTPGPLLSSALLSSRRRGWLVYPWLSWTRATRAGPARPVGTSTDAIAQRRDVIARRAFLMRRRPEADGCKPLASAMGSMTSWLLGLPGL